MTLKRAKHTKWTILITDCQEMPIRTETFADMESAWARYAEIATKVDADFSAGRFSSEIAEKPQGKY